MALTAAQISEAKAEARDFLEYSIYVLCITLDVNPDDVTGTMTIPVSADHADYSNWQALTRQAAALESLNS
jgi:hypothetical protein